MVDESYKSNLNTENWVIVWQFDVPLNFSRSKNDFVYENIQCYEFERKFDSNYPKILK